MNPYKIVAQFEDAIAEFTWARYAVAVDSCTAAIFLALEYRKRVNRATVPRLTIPTHTFCGVANAAIHAGYPVQFDPAPWKGEYNLSPLNVVDSACSLNRGRVNANMTYCLSFQHRKPLPIGRGGMLLCYDEEEADWYRKARWHGRDPETSIVEFPGYHLKMEPERAARGLEMMSRLRDINCVTPTYPDLSEQPAYREIPCVDRS